jgi:hypothetical protein
MKYVLRICVVLIAIAVAWKLLEPKIVNIMFQDDLRDLSAQLGSRIGLSPASSEEELRSIVLRKAVQRQIHLDPSRLTVRSSGPAESRVCYVAADYTVPVNLVDFSFNWHFNAASGPKL